MRKDRADYRYGVGIAIICINDWRIETLNKINSFKFESVWCKITTPNSDYYVASIYPPDPVYDACELLDFLSHTCDQILLNDPNAKIIIAGDINQLKITEFIQQHALKQMVRVCTRGERILDVFLTNYPFLWNEGRVHKGLVRSDHLVVIVSPLVPAKPSRKYVSFRYTRDHHKIDMDTKLGLWNWTSKLNFDDPEECVKVLKNELWVIFKSCIPLINVKISSRDPPYMSPLVKHLCNIRNKTARHCSEEENNLRQERINSLIRKNQMRAVKDQKKKHAKGSRGWWDTAIRITRRKTQGIPVSSVLCPDDINTYFQTINIDNAYCAPRLSVISEGCPVPTVDEYSVLNVLVHQKRTACGPDGFPYWF